MGIFLPTRKPLLLPGTNKRALRRPDARGLVMPYLSGEPLTHGEIDYDELDIIRSWRTYEPHSPGEVRYFCYELRSKNPGEEAQEYYKAVRLIRLTRVPRYLRDVPPYEQMRDVLVALREKRILFLNVIAKSPQLPLVFAYGVQGTGDTLQAAQDEADEAYAALGTLLDGTYQQLEYQPLDVQQGELLARYQTEWNHIAMARGRPMPQGTPTGNNALLDGNRTDVANSNEALNTFIRGMGDRSFMLSLVTYPLSPADMTAAWRNISHKLSAIRSDQQGARGFTAGVALPLGMGTSMGDSFGTNHTVGGTTGVGSSDGLSSSVTQGMSLTHTDSVGASQSLTATEATSQSVGQSHTTSTALGQSIGQSQSLTASETASASQSTSLGHSASQSVNQGVSTTATEGVSASQSVSASQGISEQHGVSASQGVSSSQGISASQSVGQSLTQSVGVSSSDTASVSQSAGTSQGVSVGQSSSLTQGASSTQTHGVSAGQSLSHAQSAAANWANSIGQSLSAGQTMAENWSKSMAETLTQTWGLNSGSSQSIGTSDGASSGAGLSGRLGPFGGNLSEMLSQGNNAGLGASWGQSLQQAFGGTATSGIGASLSNSLTQGLSLGESFGGSLGQSWTAGSSVGVSDSIAAGQSISGTIGQSASHSAGVSQSVSQGLSHTQGVSQGLSQGVSRAESIGQSATVGQSASIGTSQSIGASQTVGQSQSLGQSAALAQGVSSGQTIGVGQSSGIGASTGISQGLSQGQSLSQSASLSQGASDSVSASASASRSLAQGASTSVSASDATSASASTSAGASTGVSKQAALSDAWATAMSRQAGTTGSLGVVPSLGATISRQTFDEAKRSLGDVLEAQMNRYHEGIEGGGMLYQMFLVTGDRETLMGASALLKEAFWGPGKDNARLAQPFHTVVIEEEDEAKRLLTHAAAFTHYRKREPIADLIEPHLYSSYITAGELSAMTHPPTAEAVGLLAQHDSMPVLAMPANRQDREIYLGRIINGERGRVDETRFGVNLEELTHILIQGTTGLGKTTTMMRLLEQAAQLRRQVVTPPTPQAPFPTSVEARAGILCFDWMQNMRDLAHVVEPERFRLYSVANPKLGAFRWNPLAIPHPGMDPGQWLGAQADNLAASWGLGEYGRSLIAEYMDALYNANRLQDFVLRPVREADDGSGEVLRPGIVLPAIDPSKLPPGAIQIDATGAEYANVYTCPELSRLVSLEHLAVLVCTQIEQLATPEGARLMGTAMRDRVQSVWRRIQYYAPGGPMAAMVAADPDLDTRQCLTVHDLIDPDRGLVTIVETDGLDLENRRVILGSVMLAVYRYGLHVGKGCFDHGGKGPGTFLVLEEAHELFGSVGESEDRASAAMRANLYESMFRRARMTGLRLVAMTQNCGAIPPAVTSQTTTVIIHRTYDENDRKRVFSLLNWSNQIGQQLREWRYLGEMPRGYAIVRLDARESYLESAPVQILIDPPELPPVTDAQLEALAVARASAAV
jgi:hypothetical protein